jgi:hypothetical protein
MSNFEDWERQNSLPPKLAWILVAVCVLFGFAFLFVGTSQLYATQESKTWPHTKGVITESWWKSGHKSSCAVIKYKYSVGGQVFEGSNILPGRNEFLPSEEKEKLRQYPTGANVDVFYDPLDPQNSCLEVGVINRLPFLLLGIGAFFLIGACAFTWRLWKRKPIPWIGHGTQPPPVIEDYYLFPKR